MTDTSSLSSHALLLRCRCVLGFFIAALILSGITAFPLLNELNLLAGWVGEVEPNTPLQYWILAVREGLTHTYADYPWMAYGTDWLAFAHIVLAIFFIGPLMNPVRNIWVLRAGLIACAAVIPLAMICGPIRGIPFYWRLIDCSFGVFGAIPLLYCLVLAKKLERDGFQNTSA